MDFRAQLEATAFQYPMEEARLIKILNLGREPKTAMRAYALGMHRMAASFPPILVDLIEITPEPAVKYHLLENLMEEDGIFLRREIGLRVNEAARHAIWSKRFAKAVGLADQSIDVPVKSKTSPKAATLISAKRWLDTISYLLIGFEANIPRTFSAMLPGLRKLGYSERELTFFSVHVTADIEHGAVAFDLVEEWAKTPEQQATALQAVADGAREWWHRHNGDPTTASH